MLSTRFQISITHSRSQKSKLSNFKRFRIIDKLCYNKKEIFLKPTKRVASRYGYNELASRYLARTPKVSSKNNQVWLAQTSGNNSLDQLTSGRKSDFQAKCKFLKADPNLWQSRNEQLKLFGKWGIKFFNKNLTNDDLFTNRRLSTKRFIGTPKHLKL